MLNKIKDQFGRDVNKSVHRIINDFLFIQNIKYRVAQKLLIFMTNSKLVCYRLANRIKMTK